ncbi:tryptophan--tRNA ligase [Endozoicomonas sp. SM1973]|uniref:Tryptophan--tRNA ligase n=1 Tax=Spartinivicinus marinus TaxID=2994442 RepID=A0A853IH35_9GAMM|nr:tryptophan--tRNA ligase [Spartinivicinus marinus]MCX4027321.1 tryptophan--tRNA ligase [Spartinivicinus marinus]NYZ68455.1 tryptophan--tRNA ligase [Spartinivicinus marinus]
MSKTRVLTGITTTGTPHLGNYVGAIRPAIEASKQDDVQSYYFLADYHAIVKARDPERIHQSTKEIAATWLAFGLDTDKACFYRQSDIPEIMELNWIISCLTAKGLMNRAHAYKAAVQLNDDEGSSDPDKGITMGLFGYPVLMAADILVLNAQKVPVGKDQIQHLEMTRDIAGRMNHHYKVGFNLPDAVVDVDSAVLSGLDGRKMSKSYDNTIPLFVPEKKLRKLIMKIKTNSLEPGEPKNPHSCTLFEIYSAFATEEEIQAKRAQYEAGAAWGELKQELFEYLNNHLKEPRAKYEELLNNPDYIEDILNKGAAKARAETTPLLEKIRHSIGIRPINV